MMMDRAITKGDFGPPFVVWRVRLHFRCSSRSYLTVIQCGHSSLDRLLLGRPARPFFGSVRFPPLTMQIHGGLIPYAAQSGWHRFTPHCISFQQLCLDRRDL